ncbi:MAG: serine hydrolase domain-containing protein [Rhizobiaceae bacterium]|nr:serine hydrolase domain-containing protein [Rhizobiaceae bacterium]
MRGWFASLIVLLALVAAPSVAFAQSEEVLRTRKVVNGWEKWLEKHKISKASIAVSHNGKIMAQLGLDMDATDPAPVASLSKAVTGICIAKLVEAGKLEFETELKDVVSELDSSVPIKSLLRQTSGYTRDITQNPLKYKGRDKEYLEWVSRKEISKGRDKSKIGQYHYNNSNYAMLGAAIRQVTGKSYEEACNELVFEPIKITTAKLSESWRIMSAWGGWNISAVDYLKFVDAYFGVGEVLGKSPEAYPQHKFENGIRYGMGYLFRSGRHGGFNFWHQGAWDYEWQGEVARFGAYFVSYDNGWTIVINHNSSTLKGEIGEIDRLFGEATHAPL